MLAEADLPRIQAALVEAGYPGGDRDEAAARAASEPPRRRVKPSPGERGRGGCRWRGGRRRCGSG
jgi:hypothetical protein